MVGFFLVLSYYMSFLLYDLCKFAEDDGDSDGHLQGDGWLIDRFFF